MPPAQQDRGSARPIREGLPRLPGTPRALAIRFRPVKSRSAEMRGQLCCSVGFAFRPSGRRAASFSSDLPLPFFSVYALSRRSRTCGRREKIAPRVSQETYTSRRTGWGSGLTRDVCRKGVGAASGGIYPARRRADVPHGKRSCRYRQDLREKSDAGWGCYSLAASHSSALARDMRRISSFGCGELSPPFT